MKETLGKALYPGPLSVGQMQEIPEAGPPKVFHRTLQISLLIKPNTNRKRNGVCVMAAGLPAWADVTEKARQRWLPSLLCSNQWGNVWASNTEDSGSLCGLMAAVDSGPEIAGDLGLY